MKLLQALKNNKGFTALGISELFLGWLHTYNFLGLFDGIHTYPNCVSVEFYQCPTVADQVYSKSIILVFLAAVISTFIFAVLGKKWALFVNLGLVLSVIFLEWLTMNTLNSI